MIETKPDLTAEEIRIKTSLVDYGVPENLHGGLVRYIISGIRPGSFLCSVLANDLLFAVCRADDNVTVESLRAVTRFLNTEAPQQCHGSHGLVADWIRNKEKEFGVTR
jgi:hypothetical protein